MIVFDYSPFANINNKYFKNINETHKYNKINIKNAVFDELHLIESLDIECTNDKKEWQYDTVLKAMFDNSLEAGNIKMEGIPINKILIRRRKKDNYAFEDIASWDFDPNINYYEYKDRFIESYEDYVYGIQPSGGSEEIPVTGNTITQEVESEFDSVWIVGKDKQYKLMYDLEVGDYETVIPMSVIETIGNAYPIIQKSGDIKYRRGSIVCKLVSDATFKHGETNPKEEKKLRREIMSFLTDGKPKFFKDGSGETMLIAILGAPTLSPNNMLNQMIYDLRMDIVEIGSTGINSLINNGLIKEV